MYVTFQKHKDESKEARHLQCIDLRSIQLHRRFLDHRPFSSALHRLLFACHQNHLFEDPAKRRRLFVGLFDLLPSEQD